MTGGPAGLRFAVLGDSLSEGVGDPLPGGGWRGFAVLLAESLGDEVRVVNCARSGARSHDVAGPQLEASLRLRPHLASVVVGGNDTLRGGFDIEVVAAELHTAMGALRAAGAEVLTACLPDPGTVLGLPWPLARPLGRRMQALNDTVHALSAHHGALHVHAAERSWSTSPGALSADRLHPSELGHRLLARDFHGVLSAAGLASGPGPRLDPDGRPPGRAASVWWMATRGTRWVADRCTDLLPDLLRLAAEEYRGVARGTAPLLDLAAREATIHALRSLGLDAQVPVRGVTRRAAEPAACAQADRASAGPPPDLPPVRAAARTATVQSAAARAEPRTAVAARATVPVQAPVPAPAHDCAPGHVRRGGRNGRKRILVPGGDWAAAGSESSGTTPITG